jgi:hypothetical protein
MGYKVINTTWLKARKELYKLLLEIRQEPMGNVGICQHLMDMTRRTSVITLFMSYARDWPKACPGEFIIPSDDILQTPISAFYEAEADGRLWDKSTKYGRMRWELLNFVIQELYKDIGDK